jgi:hypothetical protein
MFVKRDEGVSSPMGCEARKAPIVRVHTLVPRSSRRAEARTEEAQPVADASASKGDRSFGNDDDSPPSVA